MKKVINGRTAVDTAVRVWTAKLVTTNVFQGNDKVCNISVNRINNSVL